MILALLIASLECRLEAAPTAVAGGPVNVRFVLRNTGAKAVSVLTWQTPLEGLLGDIFAITPAGGGVALSYQGPMVKRGDPDADEYVAIAAGGKTDGEVDAGAAYDLTKPGRYRLAFKGLLHDVAAPDSVPRPRDRHRPVPVSCNSLEIDVLPPASR